MLPVTSGITVDICQVLGRNCCLHLWCYFEMFLSCYQNARRHNPKHRMRDLYTQRPNNVICHSKLWCCDAEWGRIGKEVVVAWFNIIFNRKHDSDLPWQMLHGVRVEPDFSQMQFHNITTTEPAWFSGGAVNLYSEGNWFDSWPTPHLCFLKFFVILSTPFWKTPRYHV
jgi:hypothetical protein